MGTSARSLTSECARPVSSAFDLAVPALLVAVGYYVGAKLGFALTFRPHSVSTLWPPNAILLAALLLTPARAWWRVLLAALPAHLAVELQAGVPWPMVLCWFVSNSFEALCGAVGVRRFVHRPLRLDDLTQVYVFVACAGILGPLLSSFLDAGFVKLNGWGEATYWEVWRVRFFSNALAAVTVAPAIVTWGTSTIFSPRAEPRRRYVEAALLAVGLATVTAGVFGAHVAGPGTNPALLYAPLPFLLWAAVRFGPVGVSASLLTVVPLSIWDALQGRGPFTTPSAAENALSIQLLFMIVSVTLLSLAAVIQERGRAEDAARQSGERLQLALDAAQRGTWNWSPETEEMSLDSHLKQLLGYADDATGHQVAEWTRLVHPEDSARVRAFVRGHLAGESSQHEIEHRMLHRDGGIRWFLTRASMVPDENGTPRRLVGTSTDVTERRRAELDAKEQRRELAHLGRVAMLGELSGTLAHELNQPLGAIMANAGAALRLLAHEPPDLAEVRAILRDIVKDDQRAGDVIVHVRALMRRDEPRRQTFGLNELVAETVEFMHGDLIERRVSVERRLAPSLPPVLGHRVQLQQVLLNLMLNACDAMSAMPPSERRVTIATAPTPDGSVQLSVADHGPGIAKDEIDRLFEPFFSTKAHGLGLGLVICRSILEAHGGAIWARIEPQGGATLTFMLPAAERARSILQ